MKLPNEEFDFLARIDYGVKKAAAKARLMHKLGGWPIVVLENGKIIEIPPDQIEVDDDLPPSPL